MNLSERLEHQRQILTLNKYLKDIDSTTTLNQLRDSLVMTNKYIVNFTNESLKSLSRLLHRKLLNMYDCIVSLVPDVTPNIGKDMCSIKITMNNSTSHNYSMQDVYEYLINKTLIAPKYELKRYVSYVYCESPGRPLDRIMLAKDVFYNNQIEISLSWYTLSELYESTLNSILKPVVKILIKNRLALNNKYTNIDFKSINLIVNLEDYEYLSILISSGYFELKVSTLLDSKSNFYVDLCKRQGTYKDRYTKQVNSNTTLLELVSMFLEVLDKDIDDSWTEVY